MERTNVRVGGMIGLTATATAGALAEAARNEQTAFAGQVSAHLFELENKLSTALPLLMGVQAHGVPVVAAVVPMAQLSVLNHDAARIPTDQVLRELHQLFSMLSGVASGLSS